MMSATHSPLQGQRGSEENVSIEDVRAILKEPKSKAFVDLRDRAAYMYVTGAYPSHLRTFFTKVLNLISSMHDSPASLDGASGGIKLDDKIVTKMELEGHPMVIKVREFIEDGWKIRTSRGPNARKPFSKIFLEKGKDQITVQADGSVKDTWE